MGTPKNSIANLFTHSWISKKGAPSTQQINMDIVGITWTFLEFFEASFLTYSTLNFAVMSNSQALLTS